MSNDFKKIADLGSSLDSLLKDVKKNLKGSKKDLAKEYKMAVIKRATDGDGVNASNNLEAYKPLKEGTIKSRKNKNLASTTTPSFSNQTESGELIRKMVSKTRNTSSGIEIDIEPTKNRRDIAEYQEEMGRTTFAPTEEEADWVEKEIEKDVDDAIEDFLKSI